MGLLKDKDREQLEKIFSERLENNVKMILFTQSFECEFCKTTRELLEEVEALSDKISLKVLDFVADADIAKSMGIDKIPGMAMMGEKDYGIRFFGVPAGYEFTTVIEDIIDVSRGDPSLPKDVLEQVARVDEPVHLQVMVSPTCPYCPKAVRVAHRFSMVSEFIRGDMVEISEFPHIAHKYDVEGVPNTIINEEFSVVGAIPESEMIMEILYALGKEERPPEPETAEDEVETIEIKDE